MILTLGLVVMTFATPIYTISCDEECPPEDKAVCGFDSIGRMYKMFPGKCAMKRYMACHEVAFIETPVYFCIKSQSEPNLRRFYHDHESCPVFCPRSYRPVCAASNMRSYAYRAFTNGCQLDMLNCRGMSEDDGYIEVPLSFCPNHSMKNIFKDEIIAHI